MNTLLNPKPRTPGHLPDERLAILARLALVDHQIEIFKHGMDPDDGDVLVELMEKKRKLKLKLSELNSIKAITPHIG